MKGLKRFILRLFALIMLLFIVDLIIGEVFARFLSIQMDGRYFKTNYILNKSNEDIIIIGSSRAETNYNSSVISKITGMSCWNAGRGGQGLLYFLAVEQEIIKRYSPKYMVFNMDLDALSGPIDYDNMSILRPFAKNHREIFLLLSRRNQIERFKLLSNIYSYNSTLFYFFRPFFVKNKDGKPIDNGWKPRHGMISASMISKTPRSSGSIFYRKLNLEKQIILNKIIDLAKTRNIQIIFIFSPDFFPVEKETATLTYLKGIGLKNKIKVLDLSNETSLLKKQEYFYDSNHLNDSGATYFSEILAKQIIMQVQNNIQNN